MATTSSSSMSQISPEEKTNMEPSTSTANIPLPPEEEPPVKKSRRDSDEAEDFDYSQISAKDIEEYTSQLPYPLKALLRVKTPKKLKSGLWRAYCACGKCGIDRDGETYCNSELTELDQYTIVQKFWEFFKNEDMHGFIKWAGEETGRELIIQNFHKHRVNVNYLSILMFYTLPRCYVALRWLDFMDAFQQCQKNACQKNKVLVYPEYIYLPICLSDDHIVFETGPLGKRRNCSRLIKAGNEAMLAKFIMYMTNDIAKDQLIFNLKIEDHLKFLHIIADKVNLYRRTAHLLMEKNYVSKLHYCKINEGQQQQQYQNIPKELGCVTMCDPCKSNNEVVILLKDYLDNLFLQP